MDSSTIIIIISAVLGLIIIILLIGLISLSVKFKNNSNVNIDDSKLKLLINDEINKMKDNISQRMESQDKNIQDTLEKGFEKNINHLDKVNVALGKITESQSHLDSLNNEILRLNKILSDSKTRGTFGEVQLETIVKSIFGDTINTYAFQKQIVKDNKNVKPDCVIYLNDPDKTILCIDSKFSFNDFESIFKEEPKEIENSKLTILKNRLRDQIDKIAIDYIIPDLTYEYAIMFIPFDSIYNFIVGNDYLYSNVIEYSRKKNVIIVSPTTLQPILNNINIFRIDRIASQNIKDVIIEVKKIQEAINIFNESYIDFTKTYKTLANKKDKLDGKVKKIIKTSLKALEAITNEDYQVIEEPLVQEESSFDEE